MILEAEADLVPMGPRSPLRFGRCRTDVPRTSCGLRSASVGAEQTSPGLSCGLRSASVGAEQTSPGLSCAPLFRKASVVAEQAPMVQGLASGSVVAEQTSPPGRLATRIPQGFGCCVAGTSGAKVSPLHSIFRVKNGGS